MCHDVTCLGNFPVGVFMVLFHGGGHVGSVGHGNFPEGGPFPGGVRG